MSVDSLRFDGTYTTPFQLVCSNDDQGTLHNSPSYFTLSVDLKTLAPEHVVDALRLDIPMSWVSDRPTWRPVRPDDEVIEWRVFPRGFIGDFHVTVRVVAMDRGREVTRRERTIDIDLRLSGQFRPDEHVISRPNNVAGWGVVEPRRCEFDRTFRWVPFRERFFAGLYRAIVFMSGDGSNPGGLCTGMARAALERSLTKEAGEPSLAEVVCWHGRQLTDRALLTGAGWLLFGSANRAFMAFRRDLLQRGASDRCFDIGVPRLWRRDIVSALQQQGHTVVPYAIEQSSSHSAQVRIYDPNDPRASRDGGAAITFLLDQNTYVYEPLGPMALDHSTIVAVRQTAYRTGRTALLAACVSAMLAVLDSPRATRARSWILTR